MTTIGDLYNVDPNFQAWASAQGIDSNAWNTYNPQEQQGILDSFKGVGGEVSGQGILGTNITGMDALKGGLGIGQLGLGVASYLDQRKTAGKQRALMDQQLDQNRFLIDQAKTRQKDIANAFGKGGLAASTL